MPKIPTNILEARELANALRLASKNYELLKDGKGMGAFAFRFAQEEKQKNRDLLEKYDVLKNGALDIEAFDALILKLEPSRNFRVLGYVTTRSYHDVVASSPEEAMEIARAQLPSFIPQRAEPIKKGG